MLYAMLVVVDARDEPHAETALASIEEPFGAVQYVSDAWQLAENDGAYDFDSALAQRAHEPDFGDISEDQSPDAIAEQVEAATRRGGVTVAGLTDHEKAVLADALNMHREHLKNGYDTPPIDWLGVQDDLERALVAGGLPAGHLDGPGV